MADFPTLCEDQSLRSIATVQPLHVAGWIEQQTRELASPTIKQRVAAIRHLFDRLVRGQVVPVNPAASARPLP